YPKFVRSRLQILPVERARKLCRELVVKRHRIVVVDQHEMLAHVEAGPALENQRVLLAARDDPHVEMRQVHGVGRSAHWFFKRMVLVVGKNHSAASAPSVSSIENAPAVARTACGCPGGMCNNVPDTR